MNNPLELNSSDFSSLVIDGIRYSNIIFKHLADHANEGTLFRLVKIENGMVTIKRIDEVDKHE